MADKKISELAAITGSATAADDYFILVDTSGAATKKISRAELNNAIEADVLSVVNIDGGTIDGTVIGGSAAAAASVTTLNTAGAVIFNDAGANVDFRVEGDADPHLIFADASVDGVVIGGSIGTQFNAAGGAAKLTVIGSSASTNVLGNTLAAMQIVNTDQTALNTAGLHFSRADTDDSPNYAGASIVSQFGETQATGQYPSASLSFLTSSSQNSAPSLKMTLTAAGLLGLGTSAPTVPLHCVGAQLTTGILSLGSIGATGGTSGELYFGGVSGSVNGFRIHNKSGNAITFANASTTLMTIKDNGNIGIGLTATEAKLHVIGNASGLNDGTIALFEGNNDGGNRGIHIGQEGTGSQAWTFIQAYHSQAVTNYWNLLLNPYGGNVGIGTTITSNAKLTIDQGTSTYTIDLVGQDSSDVASIRFINNAYSASRAELTAVATGGLITSVSGSEKMRLDASGNVGIGKTPTNKSLELYATSNTGFRIQNSTTGTGGGDGFLLEQGGVDTLLVNYEAGVMKFLTSGAERARIDASGAVGVATTAPTEKLTVHGAIRSTSASSNFAAGAPGMMMDSPGGAYGRIGTVSGTGTGGYVNFMENGGEKMRLTSGTLVIGATAANAAGSKLELRTAASTANVLYMLKASQVEMCMGFVATGSNHNFYIGTGSSTIGTAGKGVYLSNGGTSWTSNSDFRMKKNLVPIENALDKIANCRAVTGHFKNEADDVKKRPFLIAQDWVTALPEAVDEDTVDADGVENLGLSYEGTIPLLVAAIKELREQNIALTNRITALEG